MLPVCVIWHLIPPGSLPTPLGTTASARAQPQLLLGVEIVDILLEAHIMVVHNRPRSPDFAGNLTRLYPTGGGTSRMAASLAFCW